MIYETESFHTNTENWSSSVKSKIIKENTRKTKKTPWFKFLSKYPAHRQHTKTTSFVFGRKIKPEYKDIHRTTATSGQCCFEFNLYVLLKNDESVCETFKTCISPSSSSHNLKTTSYLEMWLHFRFSGWRGEKYAVLTWMRQTTRWNIIAGLACDILINYYILQTKIMKWALP